MSKHKIADETLASLLHFLDEIVDSALFRETRNINPVMCGKTLIPNAVSISQDTSYWKKLHDHIAFSKDSVSASVLHSLKYSIVNKIFRRPVENSFGGNIYTQVGRAFEKPILNLFLRHHFAYHHPNDAADVARVLPHPYRGSPFYPRLWINDVFVPGTLLAQKDQVIYTASPDAIIQLRSPVNMTALGNYLYVLLEIKTVTTLKRLPIRVKDIDLGHLFQVVVQMFVTGFHRALLLYQMANSVQQFCQQEPTIFLISLKPRFTNGWDCLDFPPLDRYHRMMQDTIAADPQDPGSIDYVFRRFEDHSCGNKTRALLLENTIDVVRLSVADFIKVSDV